MRLHDHIFQSITISSLSAEETYKVALQGAQKNKNFTIFPLNIHSLRLIHENAEVKKAFMRATIIFPDGVPVVWLCRLTHAPVNGRVSGTDLVEKLLKTKQLRIFLLGSEENIVRDLSRRSQTSIVGTYSPPEASFYRPGTQRAILKKVNDANPNVLLVALGQPKQEIWLVRYAKNCRGVCMGVGSALDILTNKTRRAPKTLQNHGLEWAWRLYLEPRRLALRYAQDALFFLKLLTKIILYRVAKSF
jgi:N-acetylglucosaminyldiphosphoundecaprenol N-acetyl-beta-D-mannosaminyltransferase